LGVIAVTVVLAAACAGCATGLTQPPGYVAGSEAAVGGRVVSDTGGDVEYWVQYGPTTSYGSESAHATVTVSPNSPTSVFRELTGLDLSTTYHYRLCARDSQQRGGPGCGNDEQLTTPNVDCGQTITSDLQLSADLFCEPRTGVHDGLVVGADGITIDLGGHAVAGSGGAGIDNSGGYDDVTIRNGRADAFGTGILLDGASRNRIRDVRAGRATDGFGFTTSTGISITLGEANLVRDSTVGGINDGLSVNESPGLVVEGAAGGAKFGSGIQANTDLARIRNSSISRIDVNGSSNRVVGNQVGGSVTGIRIGAGSANVVAENVVEGVFQEFAVPGTGILVTSGAATTLLRANVANENEADGIQVLSASTRLKDNTANDNGDLGIEAVPGVIDGGGNRATGNGNPAQCTGVVCS
jgi:parallel beta-helix repeat protein